MSEPQKSKKIKSKEIFPKKALNNKKNKFITGARIVGILALLFTILQFGFDVFTTNKGNLSEATQISIHQSSLDVLKEIATLNAKILLEPNDAKSTEISKQLENLSRTQSAFEEIVNEDNLSIVQISTPTKNATLEKTIISPQYPTDIFTEIPVKKSTPIIQFNNTPEQVDEIFYMINESVKINGLSVNLVDYEINSDNSIDIELLVKNETSSPIVIRYSSQYFTLSDDLGNKYKKNDEYIYTIKQFQLEAGTSYSLYSMNIPNSVNEISTFRGTIPIEANYLIFHIEKFSDFSDISWRIPLNSTSLSQSQNSLQGVENTVKTPFSINGLSVNLVDYEINSDNSIDIELLVKNETSSPIVIRYSSQYFTLSDDLGNKYKKNDEYIYTIKQFQLEAGASYGLYSMNIPNSVNEISTFRGTIPIEANYLIFHIEKFSDFSDISWRIPLNSTSLSQSQNSLQGVENTVKTPFSINGLSVNLIDYEINSDNSIDIELLVKNETSSPIVIRYSSQYFTLSDDLGNKYKKNDEYIYTIKQFQLEAGTSYSLYSMNIPNSVNEISTFRGTIPIEANYLIFHIEKLSDFSDISWRIPLNSTSLSQSQNSLQGVENTVKTPFSINGLSVNLVDYEINSDNSIDIELLVKNETSSPIVIRYSSQYFTLSDDLGNKYKKNDEYIYTIKQFQLEAGTSYSLYSMNIPNSVNEISTFRGTIPIEANYLIFHIEKFSDFSDISWRIPLNSTSLSQSQNSLQGVENTVKTPFSINGLSVNLVDYEINSDNSIDIELLVKNETSSPIVIRYSSQYFTLSDDLGNKYKKNDEYIYTIKQFQLEAGASYGLYSMNIPNSVNEISTFRGTIPIEANYLIFHIEKFSDFSDISWRIPI